MFSKHSISVLVVVSNTSMGVAAGRAPCDAAGSCGSGLVSDFMVRRDAPARAGDQASRPVDCVRQPIKAAPTFPAQAPDPDAD
jgi:hypothetical protein